MVHKTINGFKVAVAKANATNIADNMVAKGIQVYEIVCPIAGDIAYLMISSHGEKREAMYELLKAIEKNNFVIDDSINLPY
ncbi:MAG: hypothetical protein IKA83_07785 [Paludibacteraceae bacterium]|nr:hypothetical protein [Paludibacteraceae bacterium]